MMRGCNPCITPGVVVTISVRSPIASHCLSYTVPDVGASELIAEGKIKLKSGNPIKRFTSTGVEFEDGSQIDADIVVFATG